MESIFSDKKIIAEIIKKVRRIKGLTQNDVAAKLNIKQSSYHRIEAGETNIDTTRLNKICEILEVDRNTFFDLYEEETSKNIFNNFVGKMDASFKHQVVEALMFYEKNAVYIDAQDFLLDLVFVIKSEGMISSITEKYKRKIELAKKLM